MILNCGTASEAVGKLGRYVALLNDGLRVPLSRDGADTVCGFEAITGTDNYVLRSPRQPMESMAAGVTCTLGALTKERIKPREVCFRYAAPPSITEHLRIFGVAPRFRQPADRIVFRTQDLERPILSANASLLAVFRNGTPTRCWRTSRSTAR